MGRAATQLDPDTNLASMESLELSCILKCLQTSYMRVLRSEKSGTFPQPSRKQVSSGLKGYAIAIRTVKPCMSCKLTCIAP